MLLPVPIRVFNECWMGENAELTTWARPPAAVTCSMLPVCASTASRQPKGRPFCRSRIGSIGAQQMRQTTAEEGPQKTRKCAVPT